MVLTRRQFLKAGTSGLAAIALTSTSLSAAMPGRTLLNATVRETRAQNQLSPAALLKRGDPSHGDISTL
jgi:hypothetical protein